ncbi:hypothetical protein [Intrasporangium sp.]|uniref:PheS-related mystery ligase SrmL n=1 Tax=Intrasporangium sp. TaxID=1925024 RepID=UPI00293A59E0|nr:hypothetical protein [Intrasporangium sp.]MDV3222062.1 hypothetical protein [Intrasporangium sp.]
MPTHLTADDLDRALRLRDLTDPAQGHHALQLVLDDVVQALARSWSVRVRTVRTPPIVSVADNYDLLGFTPQDVTRDVRYSRYLSPTTMLRSHTSADIPAALRARACEDPPAVRDELIVVPGLVYRRDVIDRTHVGEPHQVDLWRLRVDHRVCSTDLDELAQAVVDAVLPGAPWRATPSPHPYTELGRQLDVHHGQEWLELAEFGLIADHVLGGAGLDPTRWSGLALGMGLDRALMLRKGIPDIRYLRSNDPRARAQLVDLLPWHPVSRLPSIRRDLSVVIDDPTDDEELGDLVRRALAHRADDIESVHVLARTPHDALPVHVRERLGTAPGQSNAVVCLVLRPLEHTLTDREANALRNDVYRAIHRGPRLELA